MTRLDDARRAILGLGRKDSIDRVRNAIDEDLGPAPSDFASVDIRLLCPRGHFIADVTVLATDTWPGVMILPPIDHRTEPTTGLRYEEPRTWANMDQLWSRVRATCDQAKCRYRGSFAADMLAAEVAEAAAAATPSRHARYRLKS